MILISKIDKVLSLGGNVFINLKTDLPCNIPCLLIKNKLRYLRDNLIYIKPENESELNLLLNNKYPYLINKEKQKEEIKEIKSNLVENKLFSYNIRFYPRENSKRLKTILIEDVHTSEEAILKLKEISEVYEVVETNLIEEKYDNDNKEKVVEKDSN